ncbi:MAG: transposase [bacterium]
MTFVGFDLHKRYITACALDASGAIIAEVRQLSTSLGAVLTWRSALPGPVTVGMEATLYWEWMATRLATAEHTVQVAHAFHVKLIWQARAKTDPIDARKLAELLRVNLFPPSGSPIPRPASEGSCSAAAPFWSASARS